MNHCPEPWSLAFDRDKSPFMADAHHCVVLDWPEDRIDPLPDAQHIVNCVNALRSIIRRLTDAGWFNTLLLDTPEERAVECVRELLEHYQNQHTERNS